MAHKPQLIKESDLFANVCFKVASKSLTGFTSGIKKLPSRYCLVILRLAADRGHVCAMTQLGQLLLHYGATRLDKRKGIEYLTAAAKKNEPDAQYELGRIYQEGLALCFKDEKQALHWYALAAEGGNTQAVRCLADVCKK